MYPVRWGTNIRTWLLPWRNLHPMSFFRGVRAAFFYLLSLVLWWYRHIIIQLRHIIIIVIISLINHDGPRNIGSNARRSNRAVIWTKNAAAAARNTVILYALAILLFLFPSPLVRYYNTAAAASLAGRLKVYRRDTIYLFSN